MILNSGGSAILWPPFVCTVVYMGHRGVMQRIYILAFNAAEEREK